MKYTALEEVFVGCIDCADEIRAIFECSTLGTCQQIFHRPADFGQIFENPCQGQVEELTRGVDVASL